MPFLRAGRVDLTGPGNLAVHSSEAGDTRCVIGRECIVLLRNTFATTTNYIRMLQEGYSCDDTSKDNLVQAKYLSNPFAVMQDNVDLYSVGFPVVNSTANVAGGLGYKLCWGHDPKIQNAAAGAYQFDLSKIRVPIGYIKFPGPFPRDITCYFYRECR
ncbi:unnamed protein product, partial [Amoebophrya sp. A25]|eukprot:GSA25T00016913001.1